MMNHTVIGLYHPVYHLSVDAMSLCDSPYGRDAVVTCWDARHLGAGYSARLIMEDLGVSGEDSQ